MNITEEQLNKLFELASMEEKMNTPEVTSKDISEALIEIERKIYSFSSEIKIDSLENKKILIADDLELSIYQLTTVLKRIGITPRVARHKEEALSELQKAQFDCVICDLFMPESEDGIDIIKLAVQRREETGNGSKIVVISGTDDDSLIDKCYESGADLYIQKDKDWHAKLLKFIGTSFQTDKSISYTRYIINNNIASYILKRFSDKKEFEGILNNINSAILTGIKHVIFDMREILAFDIDNAYIFADIYKACAEKGGKFIIINPSPDVKEALSFAYLEDVIPCTASVESAVEIALKEE